MKIGSIPQSSRLVLGHERALDDLTRDLQQAPGAIVGEIYQASDPVVVAALRDHAAAHLPTRLLVNSHILEGAPPADAEVARSLLDGSITDVHSYGGPVGDPHAPWVHSKTFYIGGDHPHAWITNLALRNLSVEESELSVVVDGPAAEGVRVLGESAIDGSRKAVRAGAWFAAARGVLADDPTVGVHYGADAIRQLVDERTDHPLLVLTKTLDDMATTRRIVKAWRSGRPVEVYAREMGDADREALAWAGVPAWEARESAPRLRVNIVAGEDGAYVGSTYEWGPLLRRTPGQQPSRDIGVYARGAKADEVVQAARDIIASTEGWRPVVPAPGSTSGFVDEPTMVVGGRASIEAMEGVANVARQRLSGDFFRTTDTELRGDVGAAWHRGARQGVALVSAHPGSVAQVESLTPGSNVAVVPYGGLTPSLHPSLFIHSKSESADRRLAGITTLALRRQARLNLVEVTGLIHGPGAASVDDMLSAQRSGNPDLIREADLAAAARGVLVNDPVVELHLLSDQQRRLLAEEPQELDVFTKSLRDVDAVKLLVAARARGVTVNVYAGEISPDAEGALRHAGATLYGLENDPVHANVIVAKGLGQAVWSTAHLTQRAFGAGVTDGLNGSGLAVNPADAGQRSRELGAITNSPTAIHDMLTGLAGYRWTPWAPHPLPEAHGPYD
jgi:hypothetical protein